MSVPRLSIVLPFVVCIDFGADTGSGNLWDVSLVHTGSCILRLHGFLFGLVKDPGASM